MKRLALVLGLAVAIAGCVAQEKVIPPKSALFVTNDCPLVGAVGHDYYKLTRDDPPLRLRMNGEDAPWRPGCDWQSLGFNLVEVSGPEGAAATQGMGEITFNRPRYDKDGAEVRTTLKRGPDAPVKALCRLVRTGEAWTVGSCGPDPKDTQPREAAPSPADATPDSTNPIRPAEGRAPTARELTTGAADPGASRQ